MNKLPDRRVYCRSCEILFIPAAPHHDLCSACFRWSAPISWHIAAARRALRGRRANDSAAISDSDAAVEVVAALAPILPGVKVRIAKGDVR